MKITPYPQEFRSRVVERALSRPEGKSMKDIAEEFGVSEPSIYNWVAKARQEAQSLFPGQLREIKQPVTSELEVSQRRVRQLEAKNQELQYDNDTLLRIVTLLSAKISA